MDLVLLAPAFVIALFLYLHIRYHLGGSDDLEILEIGQLEPGHLDEVCEHRQPIVFDARQVLPDCGKKAAISQFEAFELNVRECSDQTEWGAGVLMPLHRTMEAIENDSSSRIFSERNQPFLRETGLLRKFQAIDTLLRPYGVIRCSYDLLMGSSGSCTPLRRHVEYRTIFACAEGNVHVRLCPPRYGSYMPLETDHENMEFRSSADPWAGGKTKVKFMDVHLSAGQGLCLPAHWWYSIKFLSSSSLVAGYSYVTAMNAVSYVPELFLHALQRWNVKERTQQLLLT